MATMNAAEVGIGSAKVTGAIWVAPNGTALPTDATTSLASAWNLLGFTSDADEDCTWWLDDFSCVRE